MFTLRGADVGDVDLMCMQCKANVNDACLMCMLCEGYVDVVDSQYGVSKCPHLHLDESLSYRVFCPISKRPAHGETSSLQ